MIVLLAQIVGTVFSVFYFLLMGRIFVKAPTFATVPPHAMWGMIIHFSLRELGDARYPLLVNFLFDVGIIAVYFETLRRLKVEQKGPLILAGWLVVHTLSFALLYLAE